MKNNCDVSGENGNTPECKGGEEKNGCVYLSSWVHVDLCSYSHLGHCTNLAAIRAAIEAEREDEIRKMLDAIEDAAFARGDMLKAPCFKCGYNGEGYFQPETHACAEKHHRLYHSKEDVAARIRGQAFVANAVAERLTDPRKRW